MIAELKRTEMEAPAKQIDETVFLTLNRKARARRISKERLTTHCRSGARCAPQ